MAAASSLPLDFRSRIDWVPQHSGQSLWPLDPPTPPRAVNQCEDFPQPRSNWKVPSGPQVERSRQQHRRVEPEARTSLPSTYDVRGREQFKASPRAARAVRPQGPQESSSGVRCEKCDEAHETDLCPHFRGPREGHADAWQNYSGHSKSAPQKPMRQCSAPRGLPFNGARVMRMPGDGSCLFHSIAFGLSILGYSEDGYSVRQRVAHFIAERPDFEITGTPLRCWVDWDSRMTVSSYASRLSAGSSWGGAIEMAACSQIFRVDLAVYEEDGWAGCFRRISDFTYADSKPFGAILVLYSGRSHYDALQMPSQDMNLAGHRGGYAAPQRQEYAAEVEDDSDWNMCSVM